ncbi:MAG TPA: sigma-70 family RNA polymerase sigma factor [Phycisphaerae bacterium]|nr:sigma-70 family RNA polymerase sigma factor [Phycisphaerae bacterium]
MAGFSADENPLLSASSRAWDELIEAVGPASLLVVIESRLSAALRRHTTAEDVFQEALMHAWRDRADCEWRGLKSFRSWLLTIIDHRIGHLAAASATQKRGAGLRITPFSGLDGRPGLGSISGDSYFAGPIGSTTPSRVAIFREQAAAMQAALAALPEELSEVVRLRLFEQITLQEIAERLGAGMSVVRRRFGSGLEIYEKALRQALVSRSPSHSARPSESTRGR